jgi:hypothetical protein
MSRRLLNGFKKLGLREVLVKNLSEVMMNKKSSNLFGYTYLREAMAMRHPNSMKVIQSRFTICLRP